MSFEETRLLQHPEVRTAYDLLMALDMSDIMRDGIIRSAEFLSVHTDKKNPHVIAAALLIEAEDRVSDLSVIRNAVSPRTFALFEEAKNALGANPNTGGMPEIILDKGFRTPEALQINMAIMASLNLDIALKIGPLLISSLETIERLKPLNIDTTDLTDEIERMKIETMMHTSSLHRVFGDFLRKTGEPKLEDFFVRCFNTVAKLCEDDPMQTTPQFTKHQHTPPLPKGNFNL